MALTLGAGGGSGATALCGGGNGRNYTGQHFLRRPILFSPSPSRNTNVIAKAAKKLSSKTGKFDSKNSKNKRSLTTTTQEEEEEGQWTVQMRPEDGVGGTGAVDVVGGGGGDFEGYFLPDLPGLEKDFWEGPQWDGLGFFVQYMWAFGLPFALIACGIAVYTYNEGATDFKQTPAYKESIQSRGLLEEPEESNSDVFESNPTEEAPSLE